jgi:hypothetical protein
MGRVVSPVVVPPPTHAIVIWRRSLVPSPATLTRRMICRIISLRSAIVVVGGMPEGWNVRRKLRDGRPLRRRQGLGLHLHKALILFLQLPWGRELVFPIIGKLSGDQAVLGLDQAIVTRRPLAFVGRSLQTLLPETVQGLALLLKPRGSLQRQGEGRGFERGEDPLADEGIDRLTRDILAIVPPIVGRQAITGVAMERSWPPVPHLQTAVAPATHQ